MMGKNRARKNDGLPPVSLIVSMGLGQVLALDEFGVGTTKQASPDQPAYPVIGIISAKSRQSPHSASG